MGVVIKTRRTGSLVTDSGTGGMGIRAEIAACSDSETVSAFVRVVSPRQQQAVTGFAGPSFGGVGGWVGAELQGQEPIGC